jgi:hypothetical protein
MIGGNNGYLTRDFLTILLPENVTTVNSTNQKRCKIKSYCRDFPTCKLCNAVSYCVWCDNLCEFKSSLDSPENITNHIINQSTAFTDRFTNGVCINNNTELCIEKARIQIGLLLKLIF